MNEVRVAVVGMGIGRENGRAISKDPRGRVVALCDLVPERMAEFATEMPGEVKHYTQESFWASHQPNEFQIELFGTDAGARLRPLTLYRLENGAPSDAVVEPPKLPGFAGVAAHFIACILDGVPCQAPLRHGLTVQRMLEGLLTSAETGREVRLD